VYSDVHGHANRGPNGGALIELGNEEFHAELVHDQAAGGVTVYVLDAAAKSAVPIDASELVINLTLDGRGEQFKLAAAPDSRDPKDKSSRFTSGDGELGASLDRDGSQPQLVVAIAGKQYRGDIAHHHEH